jgi:hypothetical protein
MKQFIYEITRHPASQFSQLIYFCSSNGECSYEQLPTDQINTLRDMLNDRGSQGWELVQVSFGEGGLLAFWKKET